jgi:hypothetical protein
MLTLIENLCVEAILFICMDNRTSSQSLFLLEIRTNPPAQDKASTGKRRVPGIGGGDPAELSSSARTPNQELIGGS